MTHSFPTRPSSDLFAAMSAAMVGIPRGKLQGDPARIAMLPTEEIVSNLQGLAYVIDREELPDDESFSEFWTASKGNPHRMASRQVRFQIYFEAITGKSTY